MANKPWYMRILTEQMDPDSTTQETPDFFKRKFAPEVRNWFKNFCKQQGFTDFQFNIGFYYFSGFFKVRDQWWYFCSADVRRNFLQTLLVRTAKDNKDFTGGRNQEVKYDEDIVTNLLAIVLPHIV